MRSIQQSFSLSLSIRAFLFLAISSIALGGLTQVASAQIPVPTTPPPDVSSPIEKSLSQQYTILGITVTGNKSGNPATIISQSGLYKGEKITLPSEDIRRAMSQLWSLGLFSDVQIVIDKETPQTDGSIGLYLTISVQEFRHLGKLNISGNKEIKTADVEKAIKFRSFDFVRPWDVSEAVRRVKALYEKEGYHFAQINVEQTVPSNDTANTVDLTFHINEGSEVVVRTIEFEGNSKVSDADLRGAMDDTHEKRWWKILTSGTFDATKYEDDKKKIINYYHSRGFRDAAILGDSIWLTGTEDLHIRINVYEGQQYYIRNIAVVGNEVIPADEIRRRLGFQRGDIYNMERFDVNLHGPSQDFSDVGSLYYDRGYVVNINKDESVEAGDSIDVTLRVQEGKQHFFRYVEIAGNSKTKDYVIRRELYVRPGESFSRAAIIRSLRQLSQLNYFNQEKLVPDVKMQPDATDVDVVFNVEERSSDTFNASVGYGGALGLTGSVGVSFNNFDISDPLHGGAGQIMSVSAEFGQSQYRNFSLSFVEPWLNQKPTTLGFSLSTNHVAYTYIADNSAASLTLGRRLRWPDDFFRIDGTLLAKRTNIENGGGIYDVGIHDELSIQSVISRVSTDNPIFPTTGSEFSLVNRFAYWPSLSPAPNEPSRYFKNAFSMKFYTPLWGIGDQNKLVFETSSEIGQLGGVGDHPFVPPTERFTMGGSGLGSLYSIPLRGYDESTIGIEQQAATSFAAGGLAYVRYNAELRFIVSMEPIPIYFLSFAEAGNVWKDFSNADLFTLKRSAGVGARVQVPAVGLIGIDFGYGFDNVQAFGAPSGWHTHFQFGRGF